MSFWSSVSNKLSSFVNEKANQIKNTYKDIRSETEEILSDEKYIQTLKNSATFPWEAVEPEDLSNDLKARVLDIHASEE